MKKSEPQKPKTPTEAQALAEKHPERFSYKNGVLNDRQAAKERGGASIVASFNQDKLTPLTPARSQELHAARKAHKLLERTRGKIDAVREYMQENDLPVTIPDPDSLSMEDLIRAEGSADYLLSKLFTLAFMRAAKESKNFRGLSEGFYKVLDTPEEREQQAPPEGTINAPVEVVYKLLAMLEEHVKQEPSTPEWIEGKVT
jgi:hypothetical protein